MLRDSKWERFLSQKRSSAKAEGSRQTESYQDFLKLRDRCRALEKSPETGPVTRESDVTSPVTRARSLAGT